MTTSVIRSFALIFSALLVASCGSDGHHSCTVLPCLMGSGTESGGEAAVPRAEGPAPAAVEVEYGTYGVPLNDHGDVLTTVSSLTTDGDSMGVLLHYPDGSTAPTAATVVAKDADADLAVVRPRHTGPAPRVILDDMTELRPGDGLYGFGREADRAKGLCSKARAGTVIMAYPDVAGPGYLNGTLIARIDWDDEARQASSVPIPCPIMGGEGVLNEQGRLIGIVTKYRVTRDGIVDGVIVIPADRIARFLYKHGIAYTVTAGSSPSR